MTEAFLVVVNVSLVASFIWMVRAIWKGIDHDTEARRRRERR